jgi:hypothetical protein
MSHLDGDGWQEQSHVRRSLVGNDALGVRSSH